MLTVRGDSLEEAEALYHQVLDGLSDWGPKGASENGTSESGHRCPQQGRARERKGGNLYCPTKLADGSWCKWRG